MINVVYSDDPSVFDHALFPTQHVSNFHYVQQQLQSFSDLLTDTGRMFMQQYGNHYASINHSEIARKARKAASDAGQAFDASAIVALETVEQLQNAQYNMQRYIMANPMYRALFHSNRVEGYSDTYVDNAPNDIGESHLDYRRATTGLLVENDDGFRVRIFMDDVDPEDPPLAHDQRINIARTWGAVEYNVEKGIDIGNKFGGEVAP